MSPTRSDKSEALTSPASELGLALPSRLQREYEVVAKLGQGGWERFIKLGIGG